MSSAGGGEVERLKAVMGLWEELADTSRPLEQRLGRCVEVLGQLLGAERVSIALVKGRYLEVAAATDPKVIGSMVSLDGESISARVAREASPIFLTDISASDLANVAWGDCRTASFISLPLVGRRGVVGVVNLSDKAGAQAFTPQDLEVAKAVCAQLSLIVELAHLNQRLAHALLAQRRLQQERDELLQSLVHDIKGPVVAARQLLGLVKSGQEPQALEMAEGALEVAWRRVGNLLDVGRMERGVLRPRVEEVELGQLVGELVGQMQGVGAAQKVQVGFGGGEALVLGDWELAERIVANLLLNAIRFSSPEEGGGGRVDVRVIELEGQGIVEVCDTGPGVDPALGDEIFARYKGMGRGSSGLGLYFSRKAARLMGGDVWFENLEGGGARFCLGLKAAREM